MAWGISLKFICKAIAELMLLFYNAVKVHHHNSCEAGTIFAGCALDMAKGPPDQPRWDHRVCHRQRWCEKMRLFMCYLNYVIFYWACTGMLGLGWGVRASVRSLGPTDHIFYLFIPNKARWKLLIKKISYLLVYFFHFEIHLAEDTVLQII